MSELSDLYQEVILDHSRKPRNFRILPDANHSAEGKNPLCGDQFTIYVNVENDRIKEITFQGSGCAISKAAASIMTDQLRGKTIAEAQSQFAEYQKMVTTGEVDKEKIGKLGVFAGVHQFPMRVKCAVLPWHAMLASLKDGAKIVSTENDGNEKK